MATNREPHGRNIKGRNPAPSFVSSAIKRLRAANAALEKIVVDTYPTLEQAFFDTKKKTSRAAKRVVNSGRGVGARKK